MEQEKKAIVFIHGFLGSNKQFREIKAHLTGCGADFVDHVVAGHGGSLEEFTKSNDEAWQNGLNEHLARLRAEYDRIYLVGHSLGGLLAVRAAVDAPEKLGGIVAIAFPLKIKLGVSWMGNTVGATKPKTDGEDPRVTAARSFSGVEIKSAGGFIRAVPNALRLLRLAKKTRRELHLLKTPLTVINLGKDGIVSRDVPELVEEALPSAKVFILKDSYHFLFGKDDEKAMAEAISATVSA